MRYYAYYEPGINGEPETVVLNEKEILYDYWPYWEEKMIKKYGAGHHLITEDNCIEDWVSLQWATEIKND